MDPQPASPNSVSFQPFAGPKASQPEDPQIAIPNGVLQPDTPEADRLDDNADADVQPAPAEPDHANEATGSKRKWSLAFAASLLFHTAVAAMLILAPESILPPRPLSEQSRQGGDGDDPARIGNSETASISGGRQQPDVTDVTVVPESELRPPSKPQMQLKSEPPAKPVPKEAGQQPKEQAEPEPATPAPEVLHYRRTQAEKDAVALQEAAPRATLEILRPVMPEPSEAERELTQQQSAAQNPQQPRSAKGANGQAQSDAMRGASDGREDGKATASGRQRQQSATGNAIASGYEALIQRKLARANRQISRATQAEATHNAWVSFVINADGSVTDVKLDRSSGSQTLDKFAVAMVKGTAPFPPIPPETGRKFWLVPIEVGPF